MKQRALLETLREKMLEKTTPWWRKALNFAMDSIRSGFGLLSRPIKSEPVTETKFSESLEENPEEETALTDPSPQPEIVAPGEPILAESEAAPLPAAQPEAVAEHEALPEPPVEEAEAVVEAEPEVAEPPQAEAMNETVPEPPVKEAEAVVEAEPEVAEIPEAVAVNEAVPEPVEEAEVVVEAEPEASETSEAEIVDEAVPEPLEEAEAVVEAEPEVEEMPEAEIVDEAVPEPPVKETEAVVEAEPEVAETPEAEAVNKTIPEPVEETEAIVKAEPEVAETPEDEAVNQAAPPLVLTTQPTAEEIAGEKTAAKLAARQKKLNESSEQSPFSVIVGQVYDGPFDLLLDLIRKQDIDIYDIPIARITAQFLAYVNQLKASDVDVAGEFIYTASLLIHIKSRMLLPRSPAGPEEADGDPRRELVERLLEHERFKNAAQMLQQKQMLEAATWTNPGFREFQEDEAAEPELAADTVDLVRIFRDILERARNRPVLNVEEDSVTVGQMIQFLARRLTMEDKPVALRRLLRHTRSERALVAMFLALLEMVRLQAVLLRQDRAFSEIFIKKHSGFDAVMNQGLPQALDDWR
jgi:segregation and condensation protein A